MTQWLVYKHTFHYKRICSHDPIKECTEHDCVLEFIVSSDVELKQQTVKEAAIASLLQISTVDKDHIEGERYTHNFGSLSTNDMLDDVKKVFLTLIPGGNKKVHLWFDKNLEFSLWDDGSDVNCLCK